GDLLREEQQNPNSKDGDLIKTYIKEGKIVPMEITVKLLSKKIQESKPALEGQSTYGRNISKSVVEPSLILFFDCDKEVMKQRLLKRGETSGRIDDNIETIEKRFKVFVEESLPVVTYYEKTGIVRKIPSNESADEVYLKVRPIIE
ncbi:14485_t:CDS:2, partial [Racocetra fulgida]